MGAWRLQIMRTLNISGETEQMLEKRAQNTLELLPSGVRTSTLLCIYRSQVCRSQRGCFPTESAQGLVALR